MKYTPLPFIFTSLSFISGRSISLSTKACFGAGCYWGTEKFFKNDFGSKVFADLNKIKGGKVGFMGPIGSKENPTYQEVCNGNTKHIEVYDLEFDGNETTYEGLVKHFFMFHDPTTVDRQGFDIGPQYSSIIYCYDDIQVQIATRIKNELQSKLDKGALPGYKGKLVVTKIEKATKFFPADESHQSYLDKNPGGYCNHFYRFKQWPISD